jgi:hypothetical protein
MEGRLLESDPLLIRFEVESSGLIGSRLRGGAELRGDLVTLTADGQFAGQQQSLRLAADREGIRVGEPDDSIFAAAAAGLRESIVIGFTRMGMLHNLARLTANATPDHMEGGVRDWVQVDSLSWGPEELVQGRPARSLDFIVLVDGSSAGSARLWVDRQSGLPLRRLQPVRFPHGDMDVTESYLFE